MPAQPPSFLAIDLGAESGRAILGQLTDGRLETRVVHRFAHGPVQLPGGLVWNTLSQHEQILQGLRLAREMLGHDPAGVAVDTWGVDFGLIDHTGALLGLPFAYREPRFAAAMKQVIARVGAESLYEQTGIQQLAFNSIFQLAAYREHQPRLLQQAAALLFTPDLHAWLLSGVVNCELSIASTSGLLEPRSRMWHAALLDSLQIPSSMLPALMPAGAQVGQLLPQVREAAGCGPVPVYACCGHDTASAVAAVPAEGVAGDWAYISSGTWSLMGLELEAPQISPAAFSSGFTNELGLGGRVRFLRNIAGLWLLQQCRAAWARAGRTFEYDELVGLAAQAFAEGPVAVVDPDHPVFLPLGDMPGRIAQFARATGQNPPQSPGQFACCCLQSLALRYRQTLGRLESLTGRSLTRVHIVGGGCQNELLNQMTADCCGRSVLAGPVEATAMGNLLVQAMAAGQIGTAEELRAVVRASSTIREFAPRVAEQARWAELFGRFERVLQSPPEL